MWRTPAPVPLCPLCTVFFRNTPASYGPVENTHGPMAVSSGSYSVSNFAGAAKSGLSPLSIEAPPRRRGDAGGWARVKSGFIFPIPPPHTLVHRLFGCIHGDRVRSGQYLAGLHPVGLRNREIRVQSHRRTSFPRLKNCWRRDMPTSMLLSWYQVAWFVSSNLTAGHQAMPVCFSPRIVTKQR